MDYRVVYNIAEICAAHNVGDAVLSPGSRNAPLTYSFVRHAQIKTYSITDERSAAFIALGMAQRSGRPVALACTSGTAAYNYAPAVAEAFFQHLPLIIFTADRPPEWIDQQDGQTIRQSNLYGSHVKGFFACPVDTSHPDAIWHFERLINEALLLATSGQPGPVHINIPFREPFYPPANEPPVRAPKIISRLNHQQTLTERAWVQLVDEWRTHKKRLIVGGQGFLPVADLEMLDEFAGHKNLPLIGDVLSNLHGMHNNQNLADLFLATIPTKLKKELQPDLLITFGESIISKNLKLFLRQYPPKVHWHIQPAGYSPDTYRSLTTIVPATLSSVIQSLRDIVGKGNVAYLNKWRKLQEQTKKYLRSYSGKQPFNEMSALHAIFDNLPLACDIHLANSMPVRWANTYGFDHTRQQVTFFANRGTSGIDGCTSTALGAALKAEKTTLLITGDMAFFYDRNAFWHKYVPCHLRIIVLNNGGGGIFDIIDGPSKQPEHEEYFLTNQPLSAKQVAAEFGLKYYHCGSVAGLSRGLDRFWVRDNQAKILEINTDIKTNTKIFQKLNRELKKLWN